MVGLAHAQRDRAEAGRVVGVEHPAQIGRRRRAGQTVLCVLGRAARGGEVVGHDRTPVVGDDLAGGRRHRRVGRGSLRVVAAVLLRAGVAVEVEAVLGRARERVAARRDRLRLELGQRPVGGALRRHHAAQVRLDAHAVDQVEPRAAPSDNSLPRKRPSITPLDAAPTNLIGAAPRQRQRRRELGEQVSARALQRDPTARRARRDVGAGGVERALAGAVAPLKTTLRRCDCSSTLIVPSRARCPTVVPV